jgi:hypothetical protein
LSPVGYIKTIKEAAMTATETGIQNAALRILESARFADSSHNVQPWKVKIKEPDTLIVSVAEERRLPEVDPENREILLSMGGFIENIVQAAEACGYAPEAEISVKDPFDELIAEIRLQNNGCAGEGTGVSAGTKTLNLMRSVYTDKRDLSAEPVSKEDLDALTALDTGEGHLHYFPRGTSEAQWVESETPKAAEVQAERDAVQRELVDLMHFSKKSAAESGTGMTPEMMGLSGIARAAWYLFFTPKTMMGEKNRKTIVGIASRQIENSGGILAITSDSAEPADLIAAGRLYQRIKLAAFERGLAVHPLSQLLQEEGWKESANEKLGTGRPVQYIARIGYRKEKPADFEEGPVPSPGIRMAPEEFAS